MVLKHITISVCAHYQNYCSNRKQNIQIRMGNIICPLKDLLFLLTYSTNHCRGMLQFNFEMLKACKINQKLRVIFQFDTVWKHQQVFELSLEKASKTKQLQKNFGGEIVDAHKTGDGYTKNWSDKYNQEIQYYSAITMSLAGRKWKILKDCNEKKCEVCLKTPKQLPRH